MNCALVASTKNFEVFTVSPMSAFLTVTTYRRLLVLYKMFIYPLSYTPLGFTHIVFNIFAFTIPLAVVVVHQIGLVQPWDLVLHPKY